MPFSKRPLLRFNMFNEEIINCKIKEIVSWMRSGGTPKSDNPDFYLGEIPFISIPDMKNKYLITSKKQISELGLNNSSSYLITKNSILLSAYATIGEICINKIDVALPQSILGIKPNDDINLEYLYYLLQKSRSVFIKLQQIGSQPNISLDIVKNIKLFVTYSSNEQTKIANFFTLLDKQIQLIERKLELYELRKKYYLNNMLKYIFDNGEKTSMKELFIEKNISPINNLIGYTPISIKLHGQGFKESSLNVKLSKGGRKYYERFPGDIVIGLQNFHNGSIGILPDSFIKPIMSNAIISFDVKKVNKLLMVEYFLSDKFLFHLRNISEGTGQKEFSKKNILDLEYFIIDKKIEELFSKFLFLSIEGINEIKKQKDQLTKRKTYYLNNMFI